MRIGPYEHIVNVTRHRRAPGLGTLKPRGSTPRPTRRAAAREKLHWQLKAAAPAIDPEKGRPTKRDRRDLERFRKALSTAGTAPNGPTYSSAASMRSVSWSSRCPPSK